MKILLASRNPGKIKEFGELLPWTDLRKWPAEAPEIPEEGAFFEDNALQKASFARDWWLHNGREEIGAVLADDSGLCVDALWGGPGVLSARFAPGLVWPDKNMRLLSMVPESKPRTARFVCVLAWLAIPGELAVFSSGVIDGELALHPRGEQGFGFDPIFLPNGSQETFGELSAEEKHQLSHRARACSALTELVKSR